MINLQFYNYLHYSIAKNTNIYIYIKTNIEKKFFWVKNCVVTNIGGNIEITCFQRYSPYIVIEITVM